MIHDDSIITTMFWRSLVEGIIHCFANMKCRRNWGIPPWFLKKSPCLATKSPSQQQKKHKNPHLPTPSPPPHIASHIRSWHLHRDSPSWHGTATRHSCQGRSIWCSSPGRAVPTHASPSISWKILWMEEILRHQQDAWKPMNHGPNYLSTINRVGFRNHPQYQMKTNMAKNACGSCAQLASQPFKAVPSASKWFSKHCTLSQSEELLQSLTKKCVIYAYIYIYTYLYSCRYIYIYIYT